MEKILIVDDDVELCDLLKQCLESEGYDVNTIHSGKGIFSAIQLDIDLVILDVMLPEISGVQVLKQIKASLQYSCLNVISKKRRNG